MSLPTCPGCGQLVDVGYDGPKVAIRPLPWPGATWHAGCAVSGFQQEQEAARQGGWPSCGRPRWRC